RGRQEEENIFDDECAARAGDRDREAGPETHIPGVLNRKVGVIANIPAAPKLPVSEIRGGQEASRSANSEERADLMPLLPLSIKASNLRLEVRRDIPQNPRTSSLSFPNTDCASRPAESPSESSAARVRPIPARRVDRRRRDSLSSARARP